MNFVSTSLKRVIYVVFEIEKWYSYKNEHSHVIQYVYCTLLMRRRVLQYSLLLHIASSKFIVKDIFSRFSFNESYIFEFIVLHLSVILGYVAEVKFFKK